jgi:hypothetical protein
MDKYNFTPYPFYILGGGVLVLLYGIIFISTEQQANISA